MDDTTSNEQRIKERAYAIWERAGQPEGQAEEHWAEAERQIQDEQGGDLAPMPGGGTAESGDHAPGGGGQLDETGAPAAGTTRESAAA